MTSPNKPTQLQKDVIEALKKVLKASIEIEKAVWDLTTLYSAIREETCETPDTS